MKEFIESFSAFSEETRTLPLSEARKLNTQFFLSRSTAPQLSVRIENIEIPTADQASIPLRIYVPKESPGLPVLIFFHRGGWVFGSVEEADSLCRSMSYLLGSIVVSVEYRLAPEHPFPIPLEDCYAATQWVSDNIDLFGGDHTRITVGGESCGGNLAAAVALLARDKGGPFIEAQLLIYPAISALTRDDVYDACPDQYFLTKEAMRLFWKMYLQSPGDAGNPYACPDQARTYENLPPCLLVTAEYDPLRAEAERYGMLLRQARVPVVTKNIPQSIHGCIDLPMYEERQKREWIQEIGLLLKKLDHLKNTQNG
jgi:acetyl esterase